MTQTVIRIFVVVLAILAPVSAFAQQSQNPGTPHTLGVSFKAAPLFASLDQGQPNWVGRKGVVGGVGVEGFRRGRLSVVGEALYVRKGAANLGGSAVVSSLELPVLLKIKIAGSDARRINVYGLGGQALDINFRTAQQTNRLNLVDPNVVLGAGVDIRWLTIEARENIGLRSLDAAYTPSLRSRTFSLMVGAKVR